MTKVTGRDNGLCQDYDKGLGRWFANRLGARQQLRQDFKMTQLITIDRATLEQLVGALEKSVGAMQGIYGGWRCEQPLKLANAAITQGRAALANVEPTGWQPIDTAPKPYEEVMVWPYPSNTRITAQANTIGAWIYSEYEFGFGWTDHVCQPTHWMPLPAAPGDTP